MVFEGMEESGSEGLDELIMKLKNEGWMQVCHVLFFSEQCLVCVIVILFVEIY